MKAKIIDENYYAPKLKIGEIVEIVPGMETDSEGIWNAPAGKLFLCKKKDGTFAYTTPYSLEILPESEGNGIDWDTFRREVAKEAMNGILSDGNSWQHVLSENRYNGRCDYPSEIAHFAIACADALIEQLKEE